MLPGSALCGILTPLTGDDLRAFVWLQMSRLTQAALVSTTRAPFLVPLSASNPLWVPVILSIFQTQMCMYISFLAVAASVQSARARRASVCECVSQIVSGRFMRIKTRCAA